MNSVSEPCMDHAAMKRVEGTELREDLLVGIPELDEDHRRFLSLADHLESALARRADRAEIQRLMSAIVDDAVQHFENEERLFAQIEYPDAGFHAAKHAQLIGELTRQKEQLDGAELSAKWFQKAFNIRYLLMDHLLEEDMKYRDFVRDRRE